MRGHKEITLAKLCLPGREFGSIFNASLLVGALANCREQAAEKKELGESNDCSFG